MQDWIVLGQIPGLSIQEAKFIRQQFSDIKQLLRCSETALLEKQLPERLVKKILKINKKQIALTEQWLTDKNHHLIPFTSKHYPEKLINIDAAPAVLYVKGNLQALSTPQIAIVGSRKPTYAGKEIAYRFACELAYLGLTVTSGLAYGIDAASHRGALSENAPTIAVVATGLNEVYPKRHISLAQQILDTQGAIISEFPLNTPPRKENFPKRNRIISGLSIGTLVVEATRRSGSLITARLASEQGREVFAVPGSIQNPTAAGCHELIQQGAALVTSTEELLQQIPDQELFEANIIKKKATSAKKSNHLLENITKHPIYNRVLSAIDEQATAIDLIISRTGLPVEQIRKTLTSLELDNYIDYVPGGYCRKSR